MKRLLKGGRVVDPANGRDGVFDILIDGDRIARVGRDLPAEDGTVVVDDSGGPRVCPGSIDMHVHLREPGQEHKETVATGTAVGGGRRIHGGRLHAEHLAGQRQRRRHRSTSSRRRPRRTWRACIRSARCRADRKASSSPTSRELKRGRLRRGHR